MLIHEVSKKTRLTKKAIDYYTEQGLVCPAILENGYRDFGGEDIARLEKLAVLRKLGLGTQEMKRVLADASGEELKRIGVRRALHIRAEQEKKELLEALGGGASYEDIAGRMQAVEQGATIAERLLEAFPGYYGRYVCLHFARFLQEPIRTQEQQEAYDTILDFLDNMPTLALPGDLQAYLQEATADVGVPQMEAMQEQMGDSLRDPAAFLTQHEEQIASYLAYKQSDAYKDSPAARLMAYMREFHTASGYYEVFIPALRRLSPAYDCYSRNLEDVSAELVRRFPQAGE